jgi:ribonuclease P protein component
MLDIPQAFVQRLKTRSQFQAVLAGTVVAKTEHFALHRRALTFRAGLSESDVAFDDAGARPAVGSSSDLQLSLLFPVHDVWIGAMVPKRWARRAVTRNAIKRQIYTLSTGLQEYCPRAAFVVRLRREFSRQQFVSAVSTALKGAVRAELHTLLKTGIPRP